MRITKAQKMRTERASEIFKMAQVKFSGRPDTFTQFMCMCFGSMSVHVSKTSLETMKEMLKELD